MTSFTYVRDNEGIVTLTLGALAQVPTIDAEFRASLREVVDRLYREKNDITGVIVTSAASAFLAGADLTELVRIGPADAASFMDTLTEFKADLRRLEMLERPVVAVMNGTALGGGFELALACHHRIAVEAPECRLGLPEVSLGLMPGAGGVTRVVRMIGVVRALTEVLLHGQRHRPSAALAIGLIDELHSEGTDLTARARQWIVDNPAAAQPWDRPGYRIPGGTPASGELPRLLPSLSATLSRELNGAEYPAPRAILATAVEGTQVDVDTALRIESRYLVSVVTGQVAKNMIGAFFFDLRAVQSRASSPNDDRGFFKTRLCGAYGLEGMALLAEGIPPLTIERAATRAGYSEGPLAVCDEVGLAHLHATTRADLLAGRGFADHPGIAVVERMVDGFGRKGRAAGGGFYDYPAEGSKVLWPGLTAFSTATDDKRVTVAVSPGAIAAIQERLLFAQTIDALRCVKEGVVPAGPEANVGAIVDIGFPSWTGGPLRFREQQPDFDDRAARLVTLYGDRFAW